MSSGRGALIEGSRNTAGRRTALFGFEPALARLAVDVQLASAQLVLALRDVDLAGEKGGICADIEVRQVAGDATVAGHRQVNAVACPQELDARAFVGAGRVRSLLGSEHAAPFAFVLHEQVGR